MYCTFAHLRLQMQMYSIAIQTQYMYCTFAHLREAARRAAAFAVTSDLKHQQTLAGWYDVRRLYAAFLAAPL